MLSLEDLELSCTIYHLLLFTDSSILLTTSIVDASTEQFEDRKNGPKPIWSHSENVSSCTRKTRGDFRLKARKTPPANFEAALQN